MKTNPTSISSRPGAAATVLATLGMLVSALHADLVVNVDLGPLPVGNLNVTGTTVGGVNNANNYANTNPAVFWGSEFVYQFSIGARSVISITTDDPNGGIDNDFFLLSTLVTTPSGATNVGATIGGLVEVSGSYGIVNAGTYYLSIDAFAGNNPAGAGNAGPFNATLKIAPATQAVPGGSINTNLAASEVLWYTFAHPGGAFAVDTLGSALEPDNDTELFLFSNTGTLAGANDDISAANFLSRISIANLPAGTYFLAACGFNSAGAAGFVVNTTSVEAGPLVINGLSVSTPPATAARLSAVSLVGDTLTLRLNGTVGRTYRIEKAVSTGGPWATDGADVTLATPEQALVRTVTPAERRLFHRATELP